MHEAQQIHSMGRWVHGDMGTWGSVISWRSCMRCGGGGSESTREETIVDEVLLSTDVRTRIA